MQEKYPAPRPGYALGSDGWYAGVFREDPRLKTLIRSRMTMLKRLFAEMNEEECAEEGYIFLPSFDAAETALAEHPFIVSLLAHLVEYKEQPSPFTDWYELSVEGRLKPEAPEIYILSRNRVSPGFELFCCSPDEKAVRRIKEVAPGSLNGLLQPDGMGLTLEIVVFVASRQPHSDKANDNAYRLSLLESGLWTARIALHIGRFGGTLMADAAFNESAVHELLELDRQVVRVLSCMIVKEVK